MKKILSPGTLAILGLLVCSCGDEDTRLHKGFRLPEGDVKSGETAFTDLQCHRCHTVSGIDLPEPKHKPGIQFELGGEVKQVKSYGELVTAIIKPHHTIAENFKASLTDKEREGTISPMLNHNHLMTVQQLTDLVTFLHAQYEKALPEYEDYPYGAP